MKRIFALVLIFAAMLTAFAGCRTSPAFSDDEPKQTRTCISQVDGKYILTLPESKKTIELSKSEVRFVPYITDQLVAQAEKKIIADEAEQYGVDEDYKVPHFFLQINDDYLCLSSERIVFGDYSFETVGGCGDHKHVFFFERISTQAVKDENNKVPGEDDPYYKNIQFFPDTVPEFKETALYNESDFETAILKDSDYEIIRMAYSKGVGWTDDATVDRLGFHFDGRIRFATEDSIGWMYFGFEDNVLYYNGRFTDITGLVKSVLDRYTPIETEL